MNVEIGRDHDDEGQIKTEPKTKVNIVLFVELPCESISQNSGYCEEAIQAE